jgi:hypothetical protein
VPLGGHIAVQGGVSVENGSVTVHAKGIPAGDILVVAVETHPTGNTHFAMNAARLTSPPAPSCVSLPSPPPGNGTTTGSGSGTTGG